MARQTIELARQLNRHLQNRSIEIKALELGQILQSLLNIARPNMRHRLSDQIYLHRRNPQGSTDIADRMARSICFNHCNCRRRTIVTRLVLRALKAIAIKDRAIYF